MLKGARTALFQLRHRDELQDAATQKMVADLEARAGPAEIRHGDCGRRRGLSLGGREGAVGGVRHEHAGQRHVGRSS
jgi:hypothetical protein